MPGIQPVDPRPARGDRRAYHLYPVRLEADVLAEVGRTRFVEALSAEGIPCSEGYGKPVYESPLFQNHQFRPRGCPISCGHYPVQIDYREVHCPGAKRACESTLWLPQDLLLGAREDIEDISRAFEKVVVGRRDLLASEE